MKRFNDLDTAVKLAVTIVTTLLVTSAIFLLSILRLNSLRNETNIIGTNSLQSVKIISTIKDEARHYRLYEYRLVTNSTSARLPMVKSSMDDISKKIEDLVAQYRSFSSDNEAKENIDAFEASWKEQLATGSEMYALMNSAKVKEANALLIGRSYQQMEEGVIPVIEKAVAYDSKKAQELTKNAESTCSSTFYQLLAIYIIGTLIAIRVSWLVSRRIIIANKKMFDFICTLSGNELTRMQSVFEAMALGDLTQRLVRTTPHIPITAKDDYGRLGDTLNKMCERLETGSSAFNESAEALSNLIVDVVQTSADVKRVTSELSGAAHVSEQAISQIAQNMQDVSQAAEQSASTSQQMAQGSEQQARSASDAAGAMHGLDEVISKMEHIATTQHKAATTASQDTQEASGQIEMLSAGAARLQETAKEATSITLTGEKAVRDTVDSMAHIQSQVENSANIINELGQAGQQIGQIVDTISGIADQTNLLALNAAIEAARAGEHGKGFAVVADEVRKLAGGATESAHQIGALVHTIQKGVQDAVTAMQASREQVTSGAANSQGAGKALSAILETANSVAREANDAAQNAGETLKTMQRLVESGVTLSTLSTESRQAAEEMVEEASRVSSAITSVASICQENAASAEEMSASAQEVSASTVNVSSSIQQQSATVTEINRSIDQLNDMARQLDSLTHRFQVSRQNGIPTEDKLQMAA